MTMANFICQKGHSTRLPYYNNNKIPECIFTFCHESKKPMQFRISEKRKKEVIK